jgi:hypothetical protein
MWKALREVDAELEQQLERLRILDTLGDRLQLEAARERDDGLDDVAAGRVGREVADELDVDLQEVERQLLEVGEAAVARAEVVERELAAEVVQVLGERARGGLVRDQRRLGYLEHEQGRIRAAPLDAVVDVGKHRRISDRVRRQVDLDRVPARGELGATPDHPAVDVPDQAVLLCHVEILARPAIPPPGSRMRRSSSRCTTSPLRRSTIGWA